VTSAAWNRDQIVDLLTDLGRELDQRGIRGDLFVVGGAAMALAFNTRRARRDVEGVFEPKAEVYEAARRIAAERGIEPDWLNDAVKGLLPGNDPHARALLDLPGLRVSVPSARYLLALKVSAARVDRDADDIRTLAQLCGVSTADEVLTLTEEVMGGPRGLLPKAQFLIEEMFMAGTETRPDR
jgi:hypothetical protein